MMPPTPSPPLSPIHLWLGYNVPMIGSLRGNAEKQVDGTVILEVNGVGYAVVVSVEDYGRLYDNKQAKLYIHEHIREQAHDLFGFSDLNTKKLFEQLLGVKNVGPKVAMAVLDIGNAAAVRGAIAGGDVKMLQSAKGVGKRAAEQIIVELRDKVGLASSMEAEQLITRSGVNVHDEALQALISLGYSELDAVTALQEIDPSLSTEERIKLALRG